MIDYFELFEQKKAQRPKCGGNTETWEHTMITYAGEKKKECEYCGYWEDIEAPLDEYDFE